MTAAAPLLPDAKLIERIAALGDKTALSELDARYGLTLFAIAYTALLDSDAAEMAVAAALRQLWRDAASFDPRAGSARAWLGELTRRAARARHRAIPIDIARAAVKPTPAAVRVPPLRRRRAAGKMRAALGRLAAALVVPALLFR